MKIIANVADLEKGGIYRIVNTMNQKLYIGSTKKFSRRAIEHQKMLDNNKHHSIHLQSAYDKYGSDAFNFEIVEIIEDASTKNLINREAYWIISTDSYMREKGYNIVKNPIEAITKTEEIAAKVSIGMKQWWKIFKETHTEEECQEAWKKYGHSPWNKGKKMTEEQTKNMHKSKTITQAVLDARQNRKYTYNYKYQVYDTNEVLLNEFDSLKELIEYSKTPECNWPLVPTKGKERFGTVLYYDKVCIHATEGTPYKGVYFRRAPLEEKSSSENGENCGKVGN